MKLYRQYLVNKITDQSGKEVLRFWENKLWIDDEGALIREEDESGLKEPRSTQSRSVTVYEYNPKGLKIVAPVKS